MLIASRKLGSEPISPESWGSARLWLAYTLFFGFMPVWLGMLAGLGFSFQRPINWRDFLIHGEFLIYSASLVATSTRLISKDVATGRPFSYRPWFSLVSSAIIIPSAAIYAIIKALSFLEKPTEVKPTFIVWFSTTMLILAIVFSFVVFLLDHHRSTTPLNLEAEANQEQVKLEKQFDELEEGPHGGG